MRLLFVLSLQRLALASLTEEINVQEPQPALFLGTQNSGFPPHAPNPLEQLQPAPTQPGVASFPDDLDIFEPVESCPPPQPFAMEAPNLGAERDFTAPQDVQFDLQESSEQPMGGMYGPPAEPQHGYGMPVAVNQDTPPFALPPFESVEPYEPVSSAASIPPASASARTTASASVNSHAPTMTAFNGPVSHIAAVDAQSREQDDVDIAEGAMRHVVAFFNAPSIDLMVRTTSDTHERAVDVFFGKVSSDGLVLDLYKRVQTSDETTSFRRQQLQSIGGLKDAGVAEESTVEYKAAHESEQRKVEVMATEEAVRILIELLKQPPPPPLAGDAVGIPGVGQDTDELRRALETELTEVRQRRLKWQALTVILTRLALDRQMHAQQKQKDLLSHLLPEYFFANARLRAFLANTLVVLRSSSVSDEKFGKYSFAQRLHVSLLDTTFLEQSFGAPLPDHLRPQLIGKSDTDAQWTPLSLWAGVDHVMRLMHSYFNEQMLLHETSNTLSARDRRHTSKMEATKRLLEINDDMGQQHRIDVCAVAVAALPSDNVSAPFVYGSPRSDVNVPRDAKCRSRSSKGVSVIANVLWRRRHRWFHWSSLKRHLAAIAPVSPARAAELTHAMSLWMRFFSGHARHVSDDSEHPHSIQKVYQVVLQRASPQLFAPTEDDIAHSARGPEADIPEPRGYFQELAFALVGDLRKQLVDILKFGSLVSHISDPAEYVPLWYELAQTDLGSEMAGDVMAPGVADALSERLSDSLQKTLRGVSPDGNQVFEVAPAPVDEILALMEHTRSNGFTAGVGVPDTVVFEMSSLQQLDSAMTMLALSTPPPFLAAAASYIKCKPWIDDVLQPQLRLFFDGLLRSTIRRLKRFCEQWATKQGFAVVAEADQPEARWAASWLRTLSVMAQAMSHNRDANTGAWIRSPLGDVFIARMLSPTVNATPTVLLPRPDEPLLSLHFSNEPCSPDDEAATEGASSNTHRHGRKKRDRRHKAKGEIYRTSSGHKPYHATQGYLSGVSLLQHLSLSDESPQVQQRASSAPNFLFDLLCGTSDDSVGMAVRVIAELLAGYVDDSASKVLSPRAQLANDAAECSDAIVLFCASARESHFVSLLFAH